MVRRDEVCVVRRYAGASDRDSLDRAEPSRHSALVEGWRSNLQQEACVLKVWRERQHQSYGAAKISTMSSKPAKSATFAVIRAAPWACAVAAIMRFTWLPRMTRPRLATVCTTIP